MKLISLIVGLIMTFGIINQVDARPMPTAAEYISMVEKATGNSKFWLLTMLGSQYAGFGWVNARLSTTGRKGVYCPPQKVAMKKERLFKILKNYVENTEYGRKVAHNIPFGGVLLYAAIHKWPCI